MGDGFRIHNRSSGAVTGRDQEPGAGLARFKRGRKAGDTVRGVFLQLEPASPGTAWVNLEGERLLAILPPDLAHLARLIAKGTGVGARPTGVLEADFPLRHGDTCFFILESLEPEPVLRMLSLAGDAGVTDAAGKLAGERALAVWKHTAGLPPAQLAALYAGLRNRLDALLHRELWGPEAFSESGGESALPPGPPQERMRQNRRAYLDYLQSKPEALDLYVDLQVHLAAFTLALRPYGLSGIGFFPWLAPGASAVELAALRQPEMRIAQAVLPDGKRVEIKLLPPLGQDCAVEGARADAADHGPAEKLRTEPRFTCAVHEPGRGDLLAALLALPPQGAYSAFSRRT